MVEMVQTLGYGRFDLEVLLFRRQSRALTSIARPSSAANRCLSLAWGGHSLNGQFPLRIRSRSFDPKGRSMH